MPDALKTDATKVRGCSASVWVYPTAACATAGSISSPTAMPRSPRASSRWSSPAVQDRPAAEVADADIAAMLAPFDLTRELSSNRTQGIPNMIALVRETAKRLAA